MKNPFRNLQKWLMALTIMTFSVVAFLAMSGTVFALPTLVAASYQDSNGDGAVDRVGLQFSETITLCTAQRTDFVYVANDITGSALVGDATVVTCTGLDALVYFALTTAGSVGITAHTTTAPTIVYTDNAGRTITGASGEVATFAGQNMVDKTAPIYVSSKTIDNNSDGTVDFVRIVYSEAIADSSVAGTDYAAGIVDTTAGNLTEAFTSAVPASGVYTDVANDATIYVGVASSGETISTNKTDYTLKVQQTAAITDAAVSPNTLASFASQTSTDGAAPIYVSSQTLDNNSNGTVDFIAVTYSESILDASVANTDYKAYITVDDAGSLTEAYASLTPATGIVTDVGNDAIIYVGVATGTETITANKTNYTLKIVQIAAVTDAIPNSYASFTVQTSTDASKPVLLTVAAGTSTFVNTIAFKYTEAMVISGCTGAVSSATCGDLTAAGTFVGLGNFGTDENLIVNATAMNSVALSTTTLTNDTVTVSLANQAGGYLKTANVAAITVPSGTVVGSAAAGIVDGAGLTVNTAATGVTADPLPSAQWDITRPTVTVATFADTYLNNAAFVAGGTFNTGTDGKADTVTLTASETLKPITDAAATRNDWATSTGATNAYGTSWVPIKAAASGTTYTINFSGLNLYYDPGTFEVINVQDLVPSFVDRAGNPLASGLTDQTYKLCYTGYSCASGTIANSAIITNSMTQPGQTGGGTDTTPPSVPTGLAATVNDSLQVVLTWTDPTASDLSNVRVYRMKNEEAAVSISVVGKGAKTYTDAAVADGDVMKYAISSLDLTGNESSKSSYVQVTVAAGAQGEAVVVTEEEEAPAEEPIVAEEEETPAEEPIIVTTESGATVTLEDVTGHWAEDEITAMAEQEIVEGDEDGNFNPNDSLNRAEAAAILYRVLGLEEPAAPTEASFTDVAIDAWYAGYVAELKALELVSGQTETTYGPALPINRAEFLNLAMNVYHYLTGTTTAEDQVTTDAFSDLNTKAWYAPVVSEAYGLEFISGSTCGETVCFNAGDPITRAEATKILYNMFYSILTAPAVE